MGIFPVYWVAIFPTTCLEIADISVILFFSIIPFCSCWARMGEWPSAQVGIIHVCVLDQAGRQKELLLKEALHVQQTTEDQHFNWDVGTDLPGCWTATLNASCAKPCPPQSRWFEAITFSRFPQSSHCFGGFFTHCINSIMLFSHALHVTKLWQSSNKWSFNYINSKKTTCWMTA